MDVLRVTSTSGAYRVVVGDGLLVPGVFRPELSPAAPLVAVVTQRNLWERYGERFLGALSLPRERVEVFMVPRGERAKSVAGAARLWRGMARRGMSRDGTVVAFGGGVVGDLAGFVAATLLRGLPWICVPTSLLAQVDACVGGKVAVDLPEGRNLVGAFHPPRLVVVDTALLASLPLRQLRSGMAEQIKYGLSVDAAVWDLCRDGLPGAAASPALVAACLRAKAAVVAADEREGGRRRLLNLGHTLGHALEGARPGRFLHGEAVAVGLLAALRLAGDRCPPGLVRDVTALFARCGLPVSAPGDVPFRDLLPFLGRDKKRTGAGLSWVLPTGPGRAVLDADVPRAAAAAAWRALQRRRREAGTRVR